MFLFNVLLRMPAVGSLLVSVASASEPAGENVARNARCTLFPQPSYRLCTDPDDRLQLTDGRTTSAYFWTQQGTVGWQHAQYAAVTIDLGKVQPIAGVSMTTAAGVAGVTWPMAVHILLSDDGKAYRDAGDLVALDRKHRGPWPEGYAIRRLATDELRARGRYVQLVIIPLPGGPYVFTDEIEVFRGDSACLEHEPSGPIVDAGQVYQEGRIRRCVGRRFHDDAQAIERAIRASKSLDLPDLKQLLERIGEAARAFDPDALPAGDSFRAVLPIGEAHARLFGVQAELWRALGRPALCARVPATWDPVDPFAVPPTETVGQVEVHTMRGEYRAAAANLANTTDRPMKVRLRFDGLPGGPAPEYVTLHEVPWTDTSLGIPVAAALPEAARDGDAWRVTVLPGLVRQVWMTFHVTQTAPGEHVGKLIVESDAGTDAATEVEVPVRLRVWPLEFPGQTTLWLGGWSYTDGRARYGVTPENRRAFLEHVQSHFVNAPWATSGVLMSYEFDEKDPAKIRLDTATLDDWIEQWPGARAYLVFLSVAHYSGTLRSSLGGVEIGSAEFERRVGTWISAWVRYLRSKGIGPDRLGLLIHDEPHEGSDIGPLLAWARAIRKAEPEVLIWEDPTYRDPSAAPTELFEACDVLCPNRPMWLDRGEAFAGFYRRQQALGRTLQFYSCSGPAKLLDPYSYYRLQAWHCWDVGGTGSYFWALGDNSGASSFNEYFAEAGPYTPLFIDEKTVTAGKQMEAIRESAEDYEYFVMLREALRRAKAAGAADALIRPAETLLRTAAAKVLAAPHAGKLRWHEPKDRRVADRVRVEILEALDSLRRTK